MSVPRLDPVDVVLHGAYAMRTRLTVAVASLAGLLVTAVPVLAHHSFAAEYDAGKPIKLAGTVTKIEWTNPHCFFHIDVKEILSECLEIIHSSREGARRNEPIQSASLPFLVFVA